MEQERVFLCNGTYTRLNNGELLALTAGEAELFCQTHRNTLVVFFKTGIEPAPAFFNHYPARVKVINLLKDSASNEFTDSYDRELAGCFDLVAGWLIKLCPALMNLKYQLNQVSVKKSIK